MELFERVVLVEDLPHTTYEIEFFAADGSTLGVETVPAHAIASCKGIKGVLHIHNIAA
jgi:hypothetical protein